jgi:hypothetical protein
MLKKEKSGRSLQILIKQMSVSSYLIMMVLEAAYKKC